MTIFLIRTHRQQRGIDFWILGDNPRRQLPLGDNVPTENIPGDNTHAPTWSPAPNRPTTWGSDPNSNPNRPTGRKLSEN